MFARRVSYYIWSFERIASLPNPGAEILMALIDLVVIAMTIAALAFLVTKGWLRSTRQLARGRILAVAGITMLLLAESITLVSPIVWPESSAMPGGLQARQGLPTLIHWLLSRSGFVLITAGILFATAQRRRIDTELQSSRQQIKVVEEGIKRSEERFRRMIETTSESVYCFEFDPPLAVTQPIAEQIRRSHDAVLVECNNVFAKKLGGDRPADIIGLKMGSLDSTSDADAYYEYFKTFIEGDYQLTDYEMIHKSPQGQDCAFQISLTGFGRDGFLDKIWGAEHNIQDLRQTKSALLSRQLCLELLADVSSRLVVATNDKADAEVKSCLKDVCLFLDADRITLCWMDWETGTGSTPHFWNRDENSGPVTATVGSFPSFVRRVLNAEVVRVDDVEQLTSEERKEQKLLKSLGVKSTLILPLIVAGEIVGTMSVGHLRKKRQWRDQEVTDLRVFAEVFANFVSRQESYVALDEALTRLQRATARLEAENVYLRQEIKSTHGFDEIIGQSGALVQCLQAVEQVARTMTPVLILGETGTGKELIARAVHECSDRSDQPLVKVNCAALPGNLIESELFGYEKGAFTGAHGKKKGRFDLANEGTLFLDEIGDIPIDLQAKLLRVLQEGEFERLGGSETLKVDVRLVVATNRDLANAVDRGEFRSDLYYRINTFPVTLPALRDRGEDIQALAEHFVRVHSQRLYRDVNAISAAMMEQLNHYSWPGNVRELEGVVQRSLISGSGPVLELAEPLFDRTRSDTDEPRIISSTIADLRIVEREHILTVLEEAVWKISGETGAAAKLGIPPSTLRSKMKKLSISRPL